MSGWEGISMLAGLVPALATVVVAVGPGDAGPMEPLVEVWANAEVYRRGDPAHVWFRSQADAYVTVFRIDTDGGVQVLYPRRPWHNNYVPGGEQLEVWDPGYQRSRFAFRADDYPGQGFLMAVSSPQPFMYSALVNNDVWDYRAIADDGRITGDPYVALMELIDRIVPGSAHEAYSYDVFPYHVEQQYEYPRFLCYDCHGYVSYNTWDPYEYYCARFRVVVHDDPAYYPTRVYATTRVVYSRPRELEPRYVFKERTGEHAYVTHVTERVGRTTFPENAEAARRAAPIVRQAPLPERRPTAGASEPANRVRPRLERRSVVASPEVDVPLLRRQSIEEALRVDSTADSARRLRATQRANQPDSSVAKTRPDSGKSQADTSRRQRKRDSIKTKPDTSRQSRRNRS